MTTIVNAPSGEKTSPAQTDKIPISGDQFVQFANLLKIINGLTEDTAPDESADYLVTYDTSAGAPKKVKPNSLQIRPQPRATNETSSATPTINTDNTDYHRITALAVAITSFTTNLSGTPNAGQELTIEILDDGTARAITWGASFAATSETALPTTTTLSKILLVKFIWSAARSKWLCAAVVNEA